MGYKVTVHLITNRKVPVVSDGFRLINNLRAVEQVKRDAHCLLPAFLSWLRLGHSVLPIRLPAASHLFLAEIREKYHVASSTSAVSTLSLHLALRPPPRVARLSFGSQKNEAEVEQHQCRYNSSN